MAAVSEVQGNEDLVTSSILERLQEYGESWLDEKGYQKFVRKKQPRSKNFQSTSDSKQSCAETDNVISRRQKKKLKRRMKNISGDNVVESDTDFSHRQSPVKRKRNKHIEQLKSELELDSNSNSSKLKEFREDVKKQASVNGISPVGDDGKLFVFEDPAKRKQKKKSVISTVPEVTSPVTHGVTSNNLVVPAQPVVNLRQARHDVKMFGITGFQGQQKETAITDMLVKLGAKPPKNSFCSIKEFVDKKEKCGAQSGHKQVSQFGMKSSKRDKKRRKQKDGIGYLDGQIGSYRSGVQILKRDDINMVKKFKVRK